MNTNIKENVGEGDLRNTILLGDVRSKLREIPDDSIDCVVTSPPYFRLRNYGNDRQIGLEDHIDGWVDEMRAVFDQLARTLKPTGSVWLNLGDSYSRHTKAGAPPKGLLLAPERLLIALANSGWIVRNKVVWAKTNPMPNAVKDRLSCTYENVYFLTRSPSYYFDLDAIRVAHRSTGKQTTPTTKADESYPPVAAGSPDWAGPLAGNNAGLSAIKRSGVSGHPLGKNPGDVWRLATASFRGAHFATFPKALVERPLLATCPQRTCLACGLPWTRELPKRQRRDRAAEPLGQLALRGQLRPTCRCASGHRPGVILDPFFGAGTVALVAEDHDRDWLGVEISQAFAALATQRIADARTERDRTRKKERRQRSTRTNGGREQHVTKCAA